MSTKHTPGPWFITGSMTRYVEAKIDGGLIQEVAAIGPTNADGGYGEQQQANAQLIVAAPDLLAALEELADLVDDIVWGNYKPDSFTTQPARAAIAKATGGES